MGQSIVLSGGAISGAISSDRNRELRSLVVMMMVVMMVMRRRGKRRGGENQNQEHGSKDLLHGVNVA
jgi:hypothetical protein